jgi:isoquinoline 1-oxidoreductase alpha subunit
LAQCGACSVLLDGVEARSCVTQISAVKQKAVTTIEGLPGIWAEKKHGLAPTASAAKATGKSSHEQLHPVQQAWIDEQVPQCGYCQSGMMIMAVNLLDTNPNPSDREIETWFSGNPKTGESAHLCRCGTYVSIKAAVKQAAKEMRK